MTTIEQFVMRWLRYERRCVMLLNERHPRWSQYAMVTRPDSSSAIWSMTGPTMRHGPHHGAQKSTIMGVADLVTSSSNVASVRVLTSLTLTPPWRGGTAPP